MKNPPEWDLDVAKLYKYAEEVDEDEGKEFIERKL